MVKRIFLLEREKRLPEYLNKLNIWCILPDGTFVGTSILNGKCQFARWDPRKNVVLAGVKFETISNYALSNEIFFVSKHRVLSFFVDDEFSLRTMEWDYKHNKILQGAVFLAHLINYEYHPLRIHELGNERFLFLWENRMLIYDSNKRNLLLFHLYVSINNSIIDAYYFLRETEEGKRLSFLSEDGHYYEGSLEKEIFDTATNYTDETQKIRLDLRHVKSKDIRYKFTSPFDIRLIQTLSNGDMLCMDKSNYLWCFNPSKQLAPLQKYQRSTDMDSVDRFIELKNGLILGYGNKRIYFSIWDRKGILLCDHTTFFLSNQLVVDSDEWGLVNMSPRTLVTLRLIHNEESLVNRCCYVLAELVEEGIITVGILLDHLPPELVKLCVGFLDDTKSDPEIVD